MVLVGGASASSEARSVHTMEAIPDRPHDHDGSDGASGHRPVDSAIEDAGQLLGHVVHQQVTLHQWNHGHNGPDRVREKIFHSQGRRPAVGPPHEGDEEDVGCEHRDDQDAPDECQARIQHLTEFSYAFGTVI